MVSYTDTYFINDRFNWVVRKSGPFPFNRWRWEQEVVDAKTSTVLARYVDFSTGSGFIGGPPRMAKFWLQTDHCNRGENNLGQMYSYQHSVRGSEK